MEVALNQEFWVCNGGYSAYVIEEDGKRYLIIPNAPIDGLIKQPITENKRYSLEVEMSSRKNVDARYIECDCCGRKIKVGETIYRLPNSTELFCSAVCFAQNFASIEKLTTQIANDCFAELKY